MRFYASNRERAVRDTFLEHELFARGGIRPIGGEVAAASQTSVRGGAVP